MGKHGDGTLYQKRGRGCWRVKWMFDGKLFDKSTGETDKAKAERKAKEITGSFTALGEARVLSQQLEIVKDKQAALEARTNPSLTLFRMIEAFISCDSVKRRRNAEATIRWWGTLGNALINEFGGNTEMRQITREQAEQFMRELYDKVSPARFNAALNFYQRVWRTLKEYDSPTELKARLHDEDPWKHIQRAKTGEVHGKKPFTDEQLIRIWRVLEKRNNPELSLLFSLAYFTGARLHDLVSWKWDANISFNTTEGKTEAIVEYKAWKTRNSTGKIIMIPINDPKAVMMLYSQYKNRKAGEEYVLPEMLRLYNINKACGLSKMIQKVFIDAGIKTKEKIEGNSRANCVYGLHSFRHTLVSRLFNSGVDLGTIQHLYTGHGSSYVTELYAKADMEKKRIDLGNLGSIPVVGNMDKPKRLFDGGLDEETEREIYEINLSDAPQNVKETLRGLLAHRSKTELEIIRDWISGRLARIG